MNLKINEKALAVLFEDSGISLTRNKLIEHKTI